MHLARLACSPAFSDLAITRNGWMPSSSNLNIYSARRRRVYPPRLVSQCDFKVFDRIAVWFSKKENRVWTRSRTLDLIVSVSFMRLRLRVYQWLSRYGQRRRDSHLYELTQAVEGGAAVGCSQWSGGLCRRNGRGDGNHQHASGRDVGGSKHLP